MAKCTITFEDDADSCTRIGIFYDPPIETPGHVPTPAQWTGRRFADALLKETEARKMREYDEPDPT